MENKQRLLLAEDDEYLGELLKEALEEEGYAVWLCHNGQEALDVFDKNKFDACLLDVMMPVKDGLTVAKKIRQQSDVIPILFISTKGRLEDKMEGYRGGADDYIVKPFNSQELLLKLQVFLRRSKKLFNETGEVYTIGRLRLSCADLRLEYPGGAFTLKQKEADLLQFFCKHPNRILRREEILLAIWGKVDFFLGRSMDVFISRIRKYLQADPDIRLETIHGTGFRLCVPGEGSR